MNNPIPSDTPEVVVAETPEVAPVPTPVVAAPPPNDSRRRMRELLSIPERDRTDEQWDELIELEIQNAPGNRVSGSEQGFGSSKPAQGRPSGGGHPKKHRPRPNPGGANATGGGNAANPGGGNAGGGGGGGNNRRPRANKPQGNPSA
jgi:hypothetical protein